MYMYLSIYLSIYLYLSLSLYIYIYIYIYMYVGPDHVTGVLDATLGCGHMGSTLIKGAAAE